MEDWHFLRSGDDNPILNTRWRYELTELGIQPASLISKRKKDEDFP